MRKQLPRSVSLRARYARKSFPSCKLFGGCAVRAVGNGIFVQSATDMRFCSTSLGVIVAVRLSMTAFAPRREILNVASQLGNIDVAIYLNFLTTGDIFIQPVTSTWEYAATFRAPRADASSARHNSHFAGEAKLFTRLLFRSLPACARFHLAARTARTAARPCRINCEFFAPPLPSLRAHLCHVSRLCKYGQ